MISGIINGERIVPIGKNFLKNAITKVITDKNSKDRPVRSYVIRSGRMTDSQRQALEKLWNDNIIPFSGESLALDKIFKNFLPVTVEVGFGMGSSLISMAREESKANFLGIEVHKPGIGRT